MTQLLPIEMPRASFFQRISPRTPTAKDYIELAQYEELADDETDDDRTNNNMRRFHTSPNIIKADFGSLARHASSNVEDFSTKSNELTIAEKIMLLACNKQVKELEKLLLWSCLCELILSERVSTFLISSDNEPQNTQSVDKKYGMYVFSKRPTGNDIVDEVLQQVIRLSIEKGTKRIADFMREIELGQVGRKITSKVQTQLVQRGILKVKTNFMLINSYILREQNTEEQIKNEICEVLETLERQKHDNTKQQVEMLTPSVFATISLLACHPTIMHKEILEACKKPVYLYGTAQEMMKNYTRWQKGIVSAMIFERIYHVLLELQIKL
jgi:predicted DNA-binding transcriptional regulator